MMKDSEVKLLIIEDDPLFRESLGSILKMKNIYVESHATIQEGVTTLLNQSFDIILLDNFLKNEKGIEQIGKLKAISPESIIVVITAFSSIDDAVKSIKLGAYDYVIKSVDPKPILEKIEEIVKLVRIRKSRPKLQQQHKDISLIGISDPILKVKEQIAKVAKYPLTTVLLTGESGTGKEVVARMIHNLGPNSNSPFVAIDCLSIPQSLAETELFGYERGAFTGAEKTKKGKFELAEDGTILLDEIGDLDLELQAKLLRVIEERQFTRVGGTSPQKLRARIIAATNCDLTTMVKEGKFRLDLFHRLSVFTIHLPPLRERGHDKLLLLNHFLKEFAELHGIRQYKLTDSAKRLLLNYDYPGNVRELKNIVEQAIILSENGVIDVRHLPERVINYKSPSNHSSSPFIYGAIFDEEFDETTLTIKFKLGEMTLEELEKRIILKVVEKTGGNKTKAATLLGISRFALLRKLKKYTKEIEEENNAIPSRR